MKVPEERDKVRILLVLDSLGSGGAQRQAILLFKGLISSGKNVQMLVYQKGDHFLSWLTEAERDRVIFLGKPAGTGGLFFPFALSKTLKTLAPSLILSFLRGPSILVGLALFINGLKCSWIVSERSSRLHQDSFFRRKLFTWVLKRCHKVVPNSWTARDEIISLGIPKRKVQVISNGIEIPAPKPAPRVKPKEGEPLRLLMVGSIQPLKNHLSVMESLVEASPEGCWQLHHCGRTQDKELMKAIKAFADRWPGKFVFHGEVFPLENQYRKAHLLVLPSAYEGFPNVLLEAWLEGCPVLVSDRCDLPRIVDDGLNGVVFELDQKKGLEKKLADFLNGPYEKYSKMGTAGFEKIETHFSMEKILDQWQKIVFSLVEGDGISPSAENGQPKKETPPSNQLQD